LAQVVVEVFVHPGGPLMRRDRTEEGMRLFRALRFATFVKLPDTSLELLLFLREISFIGDHEMLVRGTVPGKWLVIGKDWPDKRAKEAANEQSG
jgi:hypothetical protein